ncbi:hypothetical protein JR316_0004117 [Psilocybe cubensis]|uniref:Uncharacterized protein n=2 Tax=Psilocybe cubensis TaxID=181762 RepID=A0A8H7Y6I0_PSICU|nr:hypothetical protein JR316_0004117 [Psilocybe cubensis]KAH9484635.1 hypothetical protein JR316_0004117 [Psilocybe cubensis]
MSRIPPGPSNKNTSKYTPAERALIDVFKAEYLATLTPSLRTTLLTTKVYSAFASHWDAHGKKYNPDHERAELCKWARNLWRKPQVEGAVKPQSSVINIKKSDVVSRYRKDEVEKEIDTILGPVDARDRQKRFNVRATAIKNIIARLSPEELAKLEDQVAKIAEEGHPVEVRRQLAEKNFEKRLNDSATANWRELGMLSITFATYEDSSGRLHVEVHDQIAELLNLKDVADVKAFEEIHAASARGMQRLVMEYVRDMLNLSRGKKEASVPGANIFTTGQHGFPVIGPTYDRDKLDKDDAERLYRKYLSKHYELASNGRTDQVPWGDIVDNVSIFIAPEYLPADEYEFTDPHNTKIKHIKSFLDHIVEREKSLPPSQVFRFKNVTSRRRQGLIVPSCYPDEMDGENRSVNPTARKRKRKEKGNNVPTVTVHQRGGEGESSANDGDIGEDGEDGITSPELSANDASLTDVNMFEDALHLTEPDFTMVSVSRDISMPSSPDKIENAEGNGEHQGESTTIQGEHGKLDQLDQGEHGELDQLDQGEHGELDQHNQATSTSSNMPDLYLQGDKDMEDFTITETDALLLEHYANSKAFELSLAQGNWDSNGLGEAMANRLDERGMANSSNISSTWRGLDNADPGNYPKDLTFTELLFGPTEVGVTNTIGESTYTAPAAPAISIAENSKSNWPSAEDPAVEAHIANRGNMETFVGNSMLGSFHTWSSANNATNSNMPDDPNVAIPISNEMRAEPMNLAINKTMGQTGPTSPVTNQTPELAVPSSSNNTDQSNLVWRTFNPDNTRVRPRPRPRPKHNEEGSPSKIVRDILTSVPLVPRISGASTSSVPLVSNERPRPEPSAISKDSKSGKGKNKAGKASQKRETSQSDDVKLAGGSRKHLTADDLAAKEAEEMKVEGKRVRKKRLLE